MPTYRITDPATGRTLKLTGESPPSEDELNQIFSSTGEGTAKKMSWGDVATQGVKNIPSSTVEAAKSLVTPIIHPVETAKSLGKLAIGGAQKLIPGEQGYEENADQFGAFVKDRYGSAEGIKKTLATDPIGAAIDVGSLLTGGGTVVRGVGTAGKVGRLSTAGKAIQKAGAVMEPVNVAKRVLTSPAKLIPQAKIDKVYQSAAKFYPSLDPDKRLLITRTALDERIMPTIDGLDKTKSLIRGIQDEVTAKVGQADQTGHFVSLDNLFNNFDQLKDQIKRTTGDLGDVRQFELVEKSIRQANQQINRGLLTPNEAQAIKVSLHRKLQKQYEKTMSKPAKIEAQMAVATNAREWLESIIPEIKELNAKEGALLELNKQLAKASNRITNRDIFGIGIPIKATVGAGIGAASGSSEVASYAAAAGAIAGLLDVPSVKSKIGIVLNTMKNKGIKVSPTAAAMRLGLFEAGRSPSLEVSLGSIEPQNQETLGRLFP